MLSSQVWLANGERGVYRATAGRCRYAEAVGYTYINAYRIIPLYYHEEKHI